MATFSRPPASRSVDRMARLQRVMEMPFGGEGLGGELRNAVDQIIPGALTTPGLGTVVREASIPAGNTAPNMGGVVPNPVDTLGRLAQNVGGMIRGDEAQPSMSQEDYKASPYFRTEIPFEEGMTEDRAAALSTFYDKRKVAEFFASKRPISSFLGQFAGQALDPINYVPVFGPGAQTAAKARLGTIGGRLLVGASDAAINTAAFSVLTSGLREEFGDDVSFGAIVNEVAMSALVGGVFSGISPVVKAAWGATAGRGKAQALAKEASRLADIRSMQESRAVLGEVAGSIAETGDIAPLTPNSQAVVDRITTEVSSRAAAARALDGQTASVRTDAPVAITPSGQRVNVQPEVVDASTLVRASGDLQVRNRSTAASSRQVEDIAINLDPARLMPSVDADSGAPIVGPDNIVDSGNGRVMAINRAYDAYPDRAKAYRDSLIAAGYNLDGIERPVLINRRTTDLTPEARALFNAEANAPRAAQMSAVELASMDRNALDGSLDILDASPLSSAGNRAFTSRFLSNLPVSARGALVDGNGNLNADGLRRVENALVALAYGDVDAGVLQRFAESVDDNTRSIVGAMSDVAGQWARMRQAIKRGDISPEFDMTPELTEALRRIGAWREQAKAEKRPVGVVIKEGMGQLDMLSGEVSPETQAMIAAFYKTNAFNQAQGRETIATLLGRMVEAAEELGRPQLFETADVGKLEIIRNAAVNEQGNLFTPIGAVDGIEADGSLDRAASNAADRQDNRSGTPEAGSIAARMKDRFSAAGRPADEARATAELVDAFYTQQADRLGISVDELEARFGLPEVRGGGDVPAAALNQPAYHGTPHLFESFSTEKIGTGEGNQAYGWGLYFASSKEVSQWYRETLAKTIVKFDGKAFDAEASIDDWSLENGALSEIDAFGGDIDVALDSLRRDAEYNSGTPRGDRKAGVAGWIEANRGKIEVVKQGRLFEVDVPDDDDLLNWDGSLGEQPKKVQAILADFGIVPRGASEWKNFDGEADAPIIVDQYGSEIVDKGDKFSVYGMTSDNRAVHLGDPKTLDKAKKLVEDQYSFDRGMTGKKAYTAIGDRLLAERPQEERGWSVARDRSYADQLATEALRAAGIPGHRYIGHESSSKNYVVYDDKKVQVRSFEQGGENPRGSIVLGDTPIISLFETADASTALHETGHMFLSMLKGMGEAADAPTDVRADWLAVRAWWETNADAVASDANGSGRAAGITADDVKAAINEGTSGDAAKDRAIDVGMQEQWARGFEAYVREGNAPSTALARAFDQFKQWLTDIYRRATDLNVNLSPEIRQVFDNLLAPPRQPDLGLDGAPAPRVRSDKSTIKNDTVGEAAARVGKDESIRELALAHGVDPATGDFAEMADVAQIREEGRLTEADEAELDAADKAFDTAEAWGRALDAAVSCIL